MWSFQLRTHNYGAAAAICGEFPATTFIKYKLWRHCLFGCALQPLCKGTNTGDYYCTSRS